jgi:hypothetical protein
MLAFAPLMGALFVIFLPVIGFTMVGVALFQRVKRGLMATTDRQYCG